MSRRSRKEAPRWSGLVAALATAYAVNALVIGALTYAVTPEGSWLPVAVLGWIADVLFPVADIGFLGLMVGLLPDCSPRGRHRVAVGILVALTLVTMLAEGFLPHTLDSTTVANPLGVGALSGVAWVLQALIPSMFLYAVVLSAVRGWQVARERRRTGVPGSAAARVAGLALVPTFVGQAAVPESSPYAAGAVVLAGCLASSIPASRAARFLTMARTTSSE